MKLRIALAQLNFLVGDIAGNAERIVEASQHARDVLKADAVVFSELALTAYPPEDLLLRPDFLRAVDRGLSDIAERVAGIDVILGFPERAGGVLYNSAAVLRDGCIHAVYRKNGLPNYGVFDEQRYFTSGADPCVFDLRGLPVGITICEDVWSPGAAEMSASAGARLLLNINASPFHAKKIYEREQVVRERVEATKVPVVYVNQIGGQDELVFDGASFVMNAQGVVVYRAPEFEEYVGAVEFYCNGGAEPVPGALAAQYGEITSDYKAIVTGIRDYVRKNGFDGAVLGLSGGVDSALTLALAVDALGSGEVEAVMMPSRYTASMSIEDARLEAEALGVEYHVIPIEPAIKAFAVMLEKIFAGMEPDTTEENIQARCRGVILMAISNKKRKLLLT
ncbi:MAG: NAD+ synthase, partial [Pseudomonadota bacterium]